MRLSYIMLVVVTWIFGFWCGVGFREEHPRDGRRLSDAANLSACLGIELEDVSTAAALQRSQPPPRAPAGRKAPEPWVEAFNRLLHLVVGQMRALPATVSEGGRNAGWGRPNPNRSPAALGLRQIRRLGLNDASNVGRRFVLRFLEAHASAHAPALLEAARREGRRVRCLAWDNTLYISQLALCEVSVRLLYAKGSRGASVEGDTVRGDILDLASRLPQLRGSFDFIQCTQVFEHVRRPHVAAATLAELLRPGGVVVWTAPFLEKFHLSPTDYFRFTLEGGKALLQDAGLDVVAAARGGDALLTLGSLLGFGTADLASSSRTDGPDVYVDAAASGRAAAREARALAADPQRWLYVGSGVVGRKPLALR